MNKVHLLLVLAGTLFVARMAVSQDTSGATATTTSNDDLALLKEDVRSQRKQIVAANLKLTDAEAVKFCAAGRSEEEVDEMLKAALLKKDPDSAIAFTIARRALSPDGSGALT